MSVKVKSVDISLTEIVLQMCVEYKSKCPKDDVQSCVSQEWNERNSIDVVVLTLSLFIPVKFNVRSITVS